MSARGRAVEGIDSPELSPRANNPRGLGRLLIAVSVVLTLLTVLAFVVPGFYYVVVSPDADQIINTAALVVAGFVAFRAWIRYEETGERDALFQAAAFLTLFASGLLRVTLLLAGHDLYRGYERMTPGQAPLYIWIVQRFLAGILLLVGALVALRRTPRGRVAMGYAVFLAPALAMIAFGLLVLSAESMLPTLIPDPLLHRLLEPATVIDLAAIPVNLAVAQIVIACIYLAGGIAYARLWRASDRRSYTGFLAVALVAAAFTQVHDAIVPGPYGGLVSTGDVFRLLFYALALAGVAAATRQDLADLVRANKSLELLRSADAERAAAGERARLAREVHDGLVQELWLARLTTGRLAETPNMPDASHAIVKRLDSILESALGEARQAVVALQPEGNENFGRLLQRVVEDYADRFGMEIDCVVETDGRDLPPNVTGDLLRICREALNNTRKHADATRVRVLLEDEPGVVRLTIGDNGMGFEPQTVNGHGFGLRSIRERANRIGAELTIRSRPMDGARIVVDVPVAKKHG